MIDVHCHLQFQAFADDYDAVAKRAFAAGIKKIINVGTRLDSSHKAIEFADKYADMYAIVGIHPHHADKLETGWEDTLKTLTQHPKVLAIGEIGMDYYPYASNGVVNPKIQRTTFEKQIEIACKAGLPLQIHNRQAGEDVIEILTHYKNSLLPVPGMFHCFAGSMEVLKAALELGFFIGFDGNVTYSGIAKGEKTALPDLASYVPLDRIVVETDAPFLTPIPHRGTRNEPAYAIITAQFLATHKNVPYATFVEQVVRNVYTVFTKLK